jgi:type II secretory pathway component GspD/PulD (secretin)
MRRLIRDWPASTRASAIVCAVVMLHLLVSLVRSDFALVGERIGASAEAEDVPALSIASTQDDALQFYQASRTDPFAGAVRSTSVPDRTDALVLVTDDDSSSLGDTSDRDNLHVYKFQRMKASRVAGLLRQFFSDSLSSSGGGSELRNVKLIADEATNSVIVNASPKIYANLRLVFDTLDAPGADTLLAPRIP